MAANDRGQEASEGRIQLNRSNIIRNITREREICRAVWMHRGQNARYLREIEMRMTSCIALETTLKRLGVYLVTCTSRSLVVGHTCMCDYFSHKCMVRFSYIHAELMSFRTGIP